MYWRKTQGYHSLVGPDCGAGLSMWCRSIKKGLPLGCALVFCAIAAAQQYVIATYAGSPTPPFQPGPAVQTPIGYPYSPALDAAGNVYFTSPQLNSVFKLDTSGALSRIAGSSTPGYAGDGGPAANALLNLGGNLLASGLAVDRAGDLFVADTLNACIRRIATDGIITTVAGTGSPGFSGDSGPAASAQLNFPVGIAVDGSGNLFIADAYNYRIRQVSVSGIITTVAGTGKSSRRRGDSSPGGRERTVGGNSVFRRRPGLSGIPPGEFSRACRCCAWGSRCRAPLLP